ncbi:MAG TPA: ankyrin repeat domain-containing protein, partial [Burkholderiales bacterium]|nr:ankyrin repeat domain-containing protein [Burkholderiales bacterium]
MFKRWVGLASCLVLFTACGSALAGAYEELLQAAESGDLNEAGRLIAGGADVNAKDGNGVTALLGAVHFGRKEVVELLLSKGADVDARTKEGVTPLYEAAKTGNTAMADILISRGAEIDAKTRSGYTPLIIAASNGDEAMADWLISKGAAVNARDNQGNTALGWALKIFFATSPEGLRMKNAREKQNLLNLKKQVGGEWKSVAVSLIDHGADVSVKIDDAT